MSSIRPPKHDLDCQQLARSLRCSSDTIRKLARDRRIPFIELSPNQRRFNLDEVLAALRKEVVER